MPVTPKTSRTLSPPPRSASELPLSPPALNISPSVKPPRYLADSMMHFINAGLAKWDTTPELTDDVWKIVKAFRCSLKYGEGMYKTPVLEDNYRYELDFLTDQIYLRIYDKEGRLYCQKLLPKEAAVTDQLEMLVANAAIVNSWVEWCVLEPLDKERKVAMQRVIDCVQNSSTQLDLDNLNLTNIPSIPVHVLELSIENNRLTALPRLHDGLMHVWANNNFISVLPTVYPPSLKQLQLANNQITSLPEFPDTLTTISLEGNQLTHFQGLPQTAISLRLGNNPLNAGNIPDFSTFPGLLVLGLEHLGLRKIPPLPPDIAMLNMQNNPFEQIPDFKSYKKLEYLNLSNTRLTKIPDLPCGLQELWLTKNSITSLPNDLPPALKVLDVSYNSLENIGDNLPNTLIKLYLHTNKLTTFAAVLPNLSELYLSNNSLLHLTGPLSRKLEVLHIANNQLSQIPLIPRNLRELHLGNNRFVYRPMSFSSEMKYFDWGNLYDYLAPVDAIVRWYQGDENAFVLPVRIWSDIADGMRPKQITADMSEITRATVIRENERRKEETDRFMLFGNFLNSLYKLLPGKIEEQQIVRNWLERISTDPELRKNAFYLAEEASATCGDRVLLYWSRMKISAEVADALSYSPIRLALEHASERDVINRLVERAMNIFLIEKMDEGAQRLIMKARSAHASRGGDPVSSDLRSGPEEIEIMLAVHNKLSPLLLKKAAPSLDMLYFRCAGLQEADLIAVYEEIVASKKTEFISWFAQCPLWLNYARCFFNPQIAKAETRLDLAFYPEGTDEEGKVTGSGELERVTNQILAEMGYGEDNKPEDDIRIQAGKRAARQIQDRVWLGVLDEVSAINSIVADLRGLPRRPGRVIRRNFTAQSASMAGIPQASSSS